MKIKLDENTVFGLCNSLNAWLYPVRKMFPVAADYMLRAQGTITALYDKANEKKKILVADLDPMMPRYSVVDEKNRSIGEKSTLFGLLKPEYDKNGRRVGGKRGSFDDRKYKGDPPWFKFEVIGIDNLGGSVTIHAKPVVAKEAER